MHFITARFAFKACFCFSSSSMASMGVGLQALVFGVALFNDWTARDIQPCEYQPLGPFLSKNFARTLSPWMVTMDALAPFRLPFTRPEDDPAPLPHLDSAGNRERGAIDIQLEVWLQTERMRSDGHPGDRLMTSNYSDAYWTVAQLVAHHTVNGCNLRDGDLFGSGTQSGPKPEQAGSLLEMTLGDEKPITLSNSEARGYLEDGDTIVLKGYCRRDGFRRIGLGECRGTVLARGASNCHEPGGSPGMMEETVGVRGSVGRGRSNL